MLRNLRERKGLTVSQLAAKASISSRVILDYEDGQSIPLAHAKLLAKALYVSIEELMPPAGSAPPQPVGASSQAPRPAPVQSPAPHPRLRRDRKWQPPPSPHLRSGAIRTWRSGTAQVRPTPHRPPNQRRRPGGACRLARAGGGRGAGLPGPPGLLLRLRDRSRKGNWKSCSGWRSSWR